MCPTRQFNITLSADMASFVKTKIASGEYATESEVIQKGLRALMERDRAIETWLREEVVPAAIELERDPSQALTLDQVRASLAEVHRRRTDDV